MVQDRRPPSDSRPLFLGVPLDPLTFEETVQRCCALVEARRPAQHASLNAGKAVLLHDDPRLREALARAHLVSADGMGVVWAARLLGIPVPERVAGIDLMGRLLGEAEREGWPVFFLGARPEVLEAFERQALARHPRLRVAGRRDGYFRNDAEAARKVADSGARILLLGMSSPRKELFLAEHLARMGPVLGVGVGGSFDIWAGITRRAPAWMQRAGLEWTHRLAQDPRRMWRRYLLGNARFTALVLKELLQKKQGQAGPGEEGA